LFNRSWIAQIVQLSSRLLPPSKFLFTPQYTGWIDTDMVLSLFNCQSIILLQPIEKVWTHLFESHPAAMRGHFSIVKVQFFFTDRRRKNRGVHLPYLDTTVFSHPAARERLDKIRNF